MAFFWERELSVQRPQVKGHRVLRGQQAFPPQRLAGRGTVHPGLPGLSGLHLSARSVINGPSLSDSPS